MLKKPPSKDIPVNPQTLGERIRKARIERGLLQREVAKIIGVCEDTIVGWESKRSHPQLRFHGIINTFIDFN
ncbi:helix-turn-helix transcriptional regulator [Mucilaginibacter sp. AK015]|uniref:helix-turn-helix domain-containing protein n=1 Tax=Mucilaginibacter sp. AK015 TaxID=2723072 RepID=UPI001C843A3F